jgi:hypothetical protein
VLNELILVMLYELEERDFITNFVSVVFYMKFEHIFVVNDLGNDEIDDAFVILNNNRYKYIYMYIFISKYYLFTCII